MSTWRPPNDEYRFTMGDCHVLAKRLHRITGWPLMALDTGAGYPDRHAFVMMPNGMALDVRGPQEPSVFNGVWNLYGQYRWREYKVKDFVYPWMPFNFTRYSYERARKVADKLLADPIVAANLTPAGIVN